MSFENHLVLFNLVLGAKYLPAVHALEFFLPFVHYNAVYFETALCCEALPALCALKWPLTHVDNLVGFQVT